MSQLHVTRIALSLRATIPARLFEQYFPSSIETLGTQLASQVRDCVHKLNLGYFPALDFIKQQACVEPYLFDALEQVSEFALQISENEIYTLLRPIFSNVAIESLQLVCNTMPVVRPGQNHALALLSAHFTPNVIKCELNVAMLQKHAPTSGLESAAKKAVMRWLSEVFTEIEISSARLV